MITIHQRYTRTDGRTDRQTTCDRNTALCIKVHRAVKIREYCSRADKIRDPKKFKDQLPVDYGIVECSTIPLTANHPKQTD